MFDVTDPESFNNIQYWLKKIDKYGDANVEILLLANKVDLLNERLISTFDIEEFAHSSKIGYYETSAKDSINVDSAFK